MGIIKRIVNKRNLKAWERLQKEALRNLTKYDSEKDGGVYWYWAMVYDYYTKKCEECRSKI